MGDPLKASTKMGPVCNKDHYNKIKSFIDIAVKNGHQILCGETIELDFFKFSFLFLFAIEL